MKQLILTKPIELIFYAHTFHTFLRNVNNLITAYKYNTI